MYSLHLYRFPVNEQKERRVVDIYLAMSLVEVVFVLTKMIFLEVPASTGVWATGDNGVVDNELEESVVAMIANVVTRLVLLKKILRLILEHSRDKCLRG